MFAILFTFLWALALIFSLFWQEKVSLNCDFCFTRKKIKLLWEYCSNIRHKILCAWQGTPATKPNSAPQLIISASAVTDLHNTVHQYPWGGGSSLPHINRPKTTMSLHSKHQPLTFTKYPQWRRKAQMFQLCGNTGRVWVFSQDFVHLPFLSSHTARGHFPGSGKKLFIIPDLEEKKPQGNEGWKEFTALQAVPA